MRTSRRTFVTRSGLMLGGAALAGACRDAAFSPPAESSADDRWRGAIETLDRRIPELMSELHVPGVSVAIVRDARIAWRKGFGVRDVESNAAVDVDTIFEAQSMSKPVFAYRVMKLCETGVLGLDTPLTRYTPDVLVPGDPRLALVTPRRVLSHTTGLPNWRSPQTPLRFAFTIEIIAPRPADAYRLTENSRNEMLRPQIDVPSSPIPASWALGWQVWHLPVGEVIVHGGDIDGAHAQAAFSVAQRSGFVIMTNGEGGMEMISQRLLKELVDDFI